MQGDLGSADSPLPAVLLGRGRGENSAQLRADGSPSDSCNPWLAMYAKDVASAAGAGVLPMMPIAVSDWIEEPAFAHGRFRQLQSFAVPAAMTEHAVPAHEEEPVVCHPMPAHL